MADIDNMRGDTLRVVEENTLDNMRGVTQRVINENSIDNTRGVTYRVYNVNGGSAPVIDELNVTPSTSAQTITAPEGVDGYSPVNVSAVTAAIDANITAGNIKKDVSILGVTGSYEGQTPTGTMYIISNGTYNVADKAIANVQVPTTAPAHYVEKTVDANGMLKNTGSSLINFNGVTSIDSGVLAYQYQNVAFPSNTIVDLSSITKLDNLNSFIYTFENCSGLTSVDLSGLTTISVRSACDYMFRNSSITSLDLSSLTTISGTNTAVFYGCLGLTSVNFNSLTTVTANCNGWFNGCSNLVGVKMNALNVISAQIGVNYGQFFGDCTHLESVEFGGLTASTFTSVKNQFQYLFKTTTGSQAPNGCTVHFPSNFDPSDPNHTFDASTLTGYPTFGGNASYIHVAFDLPATE